MTEDEPVKRSDRFILSYQLDGFCRALRLMAHKREKPGAKTIQLLTKLRTEVGKNVTTTAMQGIPHFDAATTLPELLAIAEVLRSTMHAFLSPQEASEKRGRWDAPHKAAAEGLGIR
jgi:hypothetical protein